MDTIGFKNGRDDVAVSTDNPMPVSGPNIVYSDVTLSADTSIFASGDVIADTQVVSNALRYVDGTGLLQSLTVIDEDDQGAAFDVYFFSANAPLGTENSAPNISDGNARTFLGYVAVATGDYKDLGGVRVVSLKNIALGVKAASGTKDIYVAAVNGSGTPTFTASGLKLRLGIQQT